MREHSYCEFCDEFSGGTRNAFGHSYGNDVPDRTVLETAHLKVLPSLGHFVKGYLLVVPKVHHMALADMPTTVLREVDAVKTMLTRRLAPRYGSYTFFEHGTRTLAAGGCGIYHAHLHALPLKADAVLLKLQGQFPFRRIESILDLSTAEQGESYLYFEERAGHSWLFFPKVLPSQYLRRLAAESLGITQWDWRQSGREDTFLATRAEVLATLAVRQYDIRPGLS